MSLKYLQKAVKALLAEIADKIKANDEYKGKIKDVVFQTLIAEKVKDIIKDPEKALCEKKSLGNDDLMHTEKNASLLAFVFIEKEILILLCDIRELREKIKCKVGHAKNQFFFLYMYPQLIRDPVVKFFTCLGEEFPEQKMDHIKNKSIAKENSKKNRVINERT